MVFSHHFMANKQAQKMSMHLGKVVQSENESLRSYVQQFNTEASQIPNLTDEVAFHNFVKGLAPGRFNFELVRKVVNQNVSTIQEVLKEVESFINATEICSALKLEKPPKENTSIAKQSKQKLAIYAVDKNKGLVGKKRERPNEQNHIFTKDMHSILMEIKDHSHFIGPNLMRTPVYQRNKNKYCHYHKEIDHDTYECKQLKRLLDILVSKGMLTEYLQLTPPDKHKKEDYPDTDPETVMVISGGFAAGGPIKKGTKDKVRK